MLPIIDSTVLFDNDDKTATMVTLIGSYLDHQDPVKSRSIAMALALFPLTGMFGAHRWYLGFYKIAAFQILVTIATIGFGVLWPMVEGCLIYWGRIHKDQQGRPLK